MAAPDILGYTGVARTNDRIVGPLAASFAVIAIWEATRPVRWITAILGGWLLLGPWLLGYEAWVATLNSIAVGLLLIAFALIRGKIQQRFGEGWSSLLRSGETHDLEQNKGDI